MKIMTLVGTRPEIIKLSRIIPKLDDFSDEHVWVYSNQNFDASLRDIFIEELGLRKPDYTFKEVGYKSFLANAFAEFEEVLDREKPDKLLVLGDTNSGLLAILANKRGIPVYHMEAGLRSYDPKLPEESNRRIIDTISTYLLPHTENGRENLLKEGYHKNRVFNIGNPIYEVMDYYFPKTKISQERVLEKYDLCYPEAARIPYVFLTFHRANNVDDVQIATNVVYAINEIAENIRVICSYHPRTKDQFEKHGISFAENVKLFEPFGFLDSLVLERNAQCTISDSGTIPEQSTIFHVPSVSIREFTERQELIENGSTILCGTDTEEIIRAYYTAINMSTDWKDLADYSKSNVSDTVVRILLGKV
jgi:UDP-N-acetylglucosamine 2-epimerase (non-hydrolysing)